MVTARFCVCGVGPQAIDRTVDEALRRAGVLAEGEQEDGKAGAALGARLTAVAVTVGPGLAPCLMVGVRKARHWLDWGSGGVDPPSGRLLDHVMLLAAVVGRPPSSQPTSGSWAPSRQPANTRQPDSESVGTALG